MQNNTTNNYPCDLLIEFLTEELPPIKMLQNIGIAFANALQKKITNFLTENISHLVIVTPRRFGVLIKQVLTKAPDQIIRKKGPALSIAFQDNQPSRQLLGFMKACNINNHELLEQAPDGYIYALQTISGTTLENVLHEAIETSLKQIISSKHMRWQNNGEQQFIRPVHNLLIMHGNKQLQLKQAIFGLHSVNYTFGHRFLSNNKIIIENASSYFTTLYSQGKVIADFEQRKNIIIEQLELKAKQLNKTINYHDGLLDEVTALVEYPIILNGTFDAKFLEVPKECLILSMAKNQKYFALLEENNLTNQFLLVANIESPEPQLIINGNQKVLTARLADAEFFYNLDKKHYLGDFVEKLTTVIYHQKLGTMLERVNRLQNIASHIAILLHMAPEIANHTAYLLKADLATEMVGEFPELQGIMGKYYALLYQEKPDIARAIETHYYPRFSKDKLPSGLLAINMALTDKLETLVGIWSIGLIPTGEKDPYALRRNALGIVRILLGTKLNIMELLNLTKNSFAGVHIINENVVHEVYKFILQRLEYFLTQGGVVATSENIRDQQNKNYNNNCVRSILDCQPHIFTHIIPLLNQLEIFATQQKNEMLFTANKRIENILKQSNLDYKQATINHSLLIFEEETQLYQLLNESTLKTTTYVTQNDWVQYFQTLELFNTPVTKFFDNILVMDENIEIRNNRIILLGKIYQLLNKHCKLILLQQ